MGDPNPLWREPAYARTTRWGSVIAPPTFNRAIAETNYFEDPPPQIRGWNPFFGGTKHTYFRVIRPGDQFRVTDKYLGYEEKTKPGKAYRLFTHTAQRSYINQRDEVVCVTTANEIIQAAYPGDMKPKPEAEKAEPKAPHHYTKEELDMIHQAYDEELEGKWRRGSDVLYWEDVSVGEELRPVIKGPLDVADSAAFGWLISMNFLGAFAVKWQYLRNDLARCPIDPETGEYQHVISWHYSDKIARQMGVARAHSFGAQNEANLAHVITNWMGDDGFVTQLEVRHRAIKFFGDMNYIKGKVTKKYVENGEHLVDLEVWGENQDAVVNTTGKATVKLVSRED
jgi:acyl dehydratase